MSRWLKTALVLLTLIAVVALGWRGAAGPVNVFLLRAISI